MRTIYNRLHKLHAVNQYGLFPKMVGVDGRPEIILEGADNLEGPWLEYNFLYKPGNVNHSLPFVGIGNRKMNFSLSKEIIFSSLFTQIRLADVLGCV